MLVQFNSPRVLGFNETIIRPGINDLPADFVAAMLEDPILAGKFDNEELVVIDREDIGAAKVKTKGGKDPSGVDILLAASEVNAKKLAARTVDLDILEEWVGREKRVSVRKIVRGQIAKIRNIKFRDDNDGKKKSKYESKESED